MASSFVMMDDGGTLGPASPVSVFPRLPPPQGSALFSPPAASTSTVSTTSSRDKPVVFHARVRSSGYGADSVLPWKYRQDVSSSKKKKKLQQQTKTVRNAAVSRNTREIQDAHDDNGNNEGIGPSRLSFSIPSLQLQEQQRRGRDGLLAHAACVYSVRFSPSGTRLATSSADRTLRTFRVSSRGLEASSSFAGHDAAATRVSWSRSGSILVSSSSDGTARLWRVGDKASSTESLRIDSSSSSSSSSKMGGGGGGGKFSGDVSHASFFYMDRFVLLSYRRALHLYTYALPPPPNSLRDKGIADLDVQRRKVIGGSFKHVLAMDNTECVSVTDAIAHNAFQSHLIIAALSNRHVRVWDAGYGRVVTGIDEAHTRPVHALCLRSSRDEGAELFATSSTDGCVKLWDVRDLQRRVRVFAGSHVNSSQKLGISFSRCMKYVAVCSEDHRVAVYDVRFGTDSVHRIDSGSGTASGSGSGTRFREVPNCVDLGMSADGRSDTPRRMMMAVGGMDGGVMILNGRGVRDSEAASPIH